MKKGLFRKIMWVLNLLAVTGLILSYLAAWISPETIWWLALFGLGFEILFVINVLFVIYWLVGRNRRLFLSLLFVLLGIGRIGSIFQFHFFQESEEALRDKGYIKVMSFNVRLFNLYNWFHNKETRQRIFDFLERESPDIVCFQEFYSSDKKSNAFKNDDTLLYYLNARYAHIEYTVTLHNTDHWGIATYSKFPIVHKDAIHYTKYGANTVILSDIKIGSDTIRVVNTHLESIRFAWSDYRFLENLNKDDVEQDELQGSLTILRRLKKAFIKRVRQVEVLRDSIDASPYPVILCGDFNDTPSSYTYSVLSENMRDAFRESGSGSGKTYAGPFPSFRIDYIFHDNRIPVAGYRTIREQLSDHYPVTCLFGVGGTKQRGMDPGR
jgi:endonuclease/exonuclease/phosphatase family metal-dependent hydrolase